MFQLLFFVGLLAAVSAAFVMYFRKPQVQRMRFPRHVLRLLRVAVKRLGSSAELQSDALRLMDALVHVRSQVAQGEPLPIGRTGRPRMFELASVLVQEDRCTREDLLQALRELPEGVTSAEVAATPLCAANALCWRIDALLRQLIGLSRQPQTEECRKNAAACQEGLRQAVSELHALRHMEWLTHAEALDAAHRLLMQDPAGVYPRMTRASRLQLRLDVERFSRHADMDACDVLQTALALCQSADEGSMCACFQEAAAMTALHRALHTRKGWLYARLSCRPAQLRYAGLWAMGGLAGFAFLQAGNPVFMLPVFAIAVGELIRALLPDRPRDMLRMDVDPAEDMLHTLVVLPAELPDEHGAIAAVRKLRVLQESFPEANADYLLLGASPVDAGLAHPASQSAIAAAAVAISTLNEGANRPAMYLHCQHPAGVSAAAALICRLLAAGECPASIAWSNFDPSALYRKYAFALVVGRDAALEPMALRELLAAASHPLCTPLPHPNGFSGHAALRCEESADVRLLRPDACQEALDDVSGADLPLPLADALTNCAAVRGAHAIQPEPRTLTSVLASAYHDARRAWACAPWQLPHVQTVSGFVRNPLGYLARFRLRETLRRALCPAARLLLLLYALLTGQALLCALALKPVDLDSLRRWELPALLRRVCRFAVLPGRAAIGLWAAWNALLRKPDPDDAALLRCEIWAQGVSAALLTMLGILLPESSLLCLTLAAMQACFPWAHRLYDALEPTVQPLSGEAQALLHSAAAGCWLAFDQHVSQDTRHLPPSWVQHAPELGPAGETCPEAIGGYLLAIVCAKELGLISATKAASRMADACTTLQALPMPEGLPRQRYALPTLVILDGSVDTAAVGLLYCACLVCAQALRAWLPELLPKQLTLSAALEDVVRRIDVVRLYCEDAGLLYAGLDGTGQPLALIGQFCHEALPLTMAACARRVLPRELPARLSHTRIRLQGRAVCLSMHGTATEHLLPALFLPTDAACARHFVRAMRRHGREGVFGSSRCACLEVDAALQLRQGDFGLAGCAVHPGLQEPVYAPYAAALGLPHLPVEAAQCLQQLAAQGAACAWGFWDALDARDGMQPVPTVNLHHQALLLLSLTHVLCGAPVQRHFLALPGVEACLPLMRRPPDAALLPALPVTARPFFQHPGFELRPDRQVLPCGAHLLGQQGLQMQISAAGSQAIFLDDAALTRPAGAIPAGLQCYLRDGSCVYRIGDPAWPGECVFAPGAARFTQYCGQMTASLRIAVDPAHQQALYILTVTNLSDRERIIEAADCLLPEVPPGAASVAHGHDRSMTLLDRQNGLTVHHRLHASVPLIACTVCMDAEAFLGRERTLANPASLLEPMADVSGPALRPCLSFRARFALGARSQATLCFSLSAAEQPVPDFPALEGVLRLCAMQQRALAGDLQLTDAQLNCAVLLTGLLMGQPAKAPYRVVMKLSDAAELPVLTGLQAACRWLCAHGLPIRLSVLCAQDVREVLSAHGLTEPDLQIHAADESVDALMTFTGERPLHEQLQAAQYAVPAEAPLPPAPPQNTSPDDTPPAIRGFDAENSDYVVQLWPGLTTPAPWRNVHRSHGWRETVTDSGPIGPYREQVLVCLDDGTAMTPWSAGLPRTIRFGRGETCWSAESETLEITLHAAVLPHQTCGMRALRLHNRSDHPLSAQVQVTAILPECTVPGREGAAQAASAGTIPTCIGGGVWQAYPTVPHLLTHADGAPVRQPPAVPGGHAVVLTQAVTIAAHGSEEVVWLSGQASQPQRLHQAAAQLREEGVSDALRALRSAWVGLVPLSVNTPDKDLNCLMNRILPVQCLTADGLAGLPALAFLAPRHALRRLLRAAMQAKSREDWLQIAVHLAYLAQRTLPAGMPDVLLPGIPVPLIDACGEALLSLPLDGHGLPMTDDPARDCFLYATAAGQLSRLRPSERLDELRRKLLNTADSRLWHDGFYGLDGVLRLDIQALADTAYGPDARTSSAIRKAWSSLWQPRTGLLRQMQAQDGRLLPGMPGNGGMQLLPAAGFLASLLRHGMTEEAAMLLHSMNPLSCTDTALGCERFCSAPFRLPGGLLDNPMAAGRAIDTGGDMAAGWLYVIVLERLLGCRLQGNILHMNPRIPKAWDGFTLTRQYGASTWHISVERRRDAPTVDGKPFRGDQFSLYDDGRVHQLRFPIA